LISTTIANRNALMSTDFVAAHLDEKSIRVIDVLIKAPRRWKRPPQQAIRDRRSRLLAFVTSPRPLWPKSEKQTSPGSPQSGR
jgi:hypothetical protein